MKGKGKPAVGPELAAPPKGLGEKGLVFWVSTVQKYGIPPGSPELAQLEMTCLNYDNWHEQNSLLNDPDLKPNDRRSVAIAMGIIEDKILNSLKAMGMTTPERKPVVSVDEEDAKSRRPKTMLDDLTPDELRKMREPAS